MSFRTPAARQADTHLRRLIHDYLTKHGPTARLDLVKAITAQYMHQRRQEALAVGKRYTQGRERIHERVLTLVMNDVQSTLLKKTPQGVIYLP